MASAAILPPPLSDTPSVETLERLLVGLHQPMQRGVPSPPPPDRLLDLTALEHAPAVQRPAGPAGPPSLSWSAGTRRRVLSSPAATAVGVAVVTAAAAVAGLAATGELSLP